MINALQPSKCSMLTTRSNSLEKRAEHSKAKGSKGSTQCPLDKLSRRVQLVLL